MTEWQNLPLDRVYPVVFIVPHFVGGAPSHPTRDPRRAGHQPAHLRDDRGHRQWRTRHPRTWVGDGGEGAKFWLPVLAEMPQALRAGRDPQNRGVEDVCIVVCDGLGGLPDAINTVWELAIVQTCVIHLIRNTFRFAARQCWGDMARDLEPVYTAPTEAAAKAAPGPVGTTTPPSSPPPTCSSPPCD